MSTVKRGPGGQFQGSYGSGRRPAPSRRPYGRVSPARVAVVAVVGAATIGIFAGSVGVAWIALGGAGAFFGTKATIRYLRSPRGRALIAKITKKPTKKTPAKAAVPIPPRRPRDPATGRYTKETSA